MTVRRARPLIQLLAALLAVAGAPPSAAFFIPGFSLPAPAPGGPPSPSPPPPPHPPPPPTPPPPAVLSRACANASAPLCNPDGVLGGGGAAAVRAAAASLLAGGDGAGACANATARSAAATGRGPGGWAVLVAVVRVADAREADAFARSVRRAWADAGETACGDGLVVVVAAETRVALLDAGRRVRERVGAAALATAADAMRATLDAWEDGGVTRALVGALRAAAAGQRDGRPPRPRTWRDALAAAARAAARAPLVALDWLARALTVAWEYFPLFYLLGLAVGALLQCLEPVLPARLVFWRRRRSRRRLRADPAAARARYTATADALRRVDPGKAGAGGGGVYGASACAICLERFAPASPGGSADALDEATPLLGAPAPADADLRALTCGHVFHRDCIVLWLASAGTAVRRRCPICRAEEPAAAAGSVV